MKTSRLQCRATIGILAGALALCLPPKVRAQTILEVLPLPTNVCITVAGSNSSGQPAGQITAGQACSYQASGCVGINTCLFSGTCMSADPDGNTYVGTSCGGSSTESSASQTFECPGLVAYSLVGTVNGNCIQLGTSGSFAPPTSGPLLLYVNDDYYGDNSGSFNVCVQIPEPGLLSSGGTGGPFNPSSRIYTLTNSGATSLSWSATNAQNWVSLSSTLGTLAPGASAAVTVSINTNADTLAAGVYADTVSFTNLTSGNGSTDRPVGLTVVDLPAAPSALSATTVSEFQINLSWTDNSTNEDGFKVERSLDGTNFTQIAQLLPDTTVYRNTSLFPGTSYSYRVCAYRTGMQLVP